MNERRFKGPLVLTILDGWGHRDETYGNAIAAASLPNWHRFLESSTKTLVAASGADVGLPPGVMGNSEVGHINIGSGRVVPQGVVVINESLADGTFARNATLAQCIAHVRETGGRLHFMGLLSDGRVHSSIDHLFALVDAAAQAKVPFAIEAFGDGRDVPPRSMHRYVEALEAHLARSGNADAIALICGRYYAMDRDQRWERLELAYRALLGTAPHHVATAREAIDAAYARGENDEFIVPTTVGEPRPISDGDAVIFFNFRPDRARELTLAFSKPDFSEFETHLFSNFIFATMTKYEEYFTNPVLFGPRPQCDTFGEVVAQAGMAQLRLAETEKYAHVTYFFNGGREEVFEKEERVLIPSNRIVATYDLAPEMRAAEITTAAIEAITSRAYDLIVMNYANADMVGHTGVIEATISSLETLDVSLGRLYNAVIDADGLLAITADHGNAEEKLDEKGNPLTAHTTNPVPLVLIGRSDLGTFYSGGRLGDIAPTLLPLLGLEVPAAMTGRNLLAPGA
ncbi:MAG TPA: 2,3-bisphosphoglycerate-independent phosphoglycerate mutase [Candidatus Acidoferrales bacterium]|nr:2,3-bisphosphoglycerate-independent phosphoglycerate mutase [Candidatus Acidoferrales bacterium]